jgi:L-fuculose-phosphate aldolase
MLLQKEREQVVEYGKKLISSGLTKGTSGNISIYNKEEKLMAISPSGIGYFETNPEDVVVMSLDGKIVDGDKKPSSEHDLHSAVYKVRDDVTAVVHTHSMYCTTFAAMRLPIEAVHYVIGMAGHKVACAEYATYGTPELAKSAIAAIGSDNAVLLANHGALTVGPNIARAFAIADQLEFVAEVYYRTKCLGKPVILDTAEMDRVIEKFKTHGQKKKASGGY